MGNWAQRRLRGSPAVGAAPAAALLPPVWGVDVIASGPVEDAWSFDSQDTANNELAASMGAVCFVFQDGGLIGELALPVGGLLAGNAFATADYTLQYYVDGLPATALSDPLTLP